MFESDRTTKQVYKTFSNNKTGTLNRGRNVNYYFEMNPRGKLRNL